MSEPGPDPSRRALSGKELWTALWPTAALFGGLAVGALYSTTLGLLLAGPGLVYIVVELWRMPREQKARLAAVVHAHDKTPWGRVGRLIQLITLLCVAAAAVQWLLRYL